MKRGDGGGGGEGRRTKGNAREPRERKTGQEFGGLACLLRGRSSRAIATEVNEDL